MGTKHVSHWWESGPIVLLGTGFGFGTFEVFGGKQNVRATRLPNEHLPL